jgi:hypothetical protein
VPHCPLHFVILLVDAISVLPQKRDFLRMSVQKIPILVTFDTNSYSAVARPQVARLFTKLRPLSWARWTERLVRVYVQWCIRRGRIVAAIPEAAFEAEVFRNIDRIDLILAIGTPRAAQLPKIPDVRRMIIDKAFEIGFRVMHGGRISYGEMIGVRLDQWAADQRFTATERHDRFSTFLRHFSQFPFEALKTFGERLAVAHGLPPLPPQDAWRQGLAAERVTLLRHSSEKAFYGVVRSLFADWADFDIVTTHFAYGYDLLCTGSAQKRAKTQFSGKSTHPMSAAVSV